MTFFLFISIFDIILKKRQRHNILLKSHRYFTRSSSYARLSCSRNLSLDEFVKRTSFAMFTPSTSDTLQMTMTYSNKSNNRYTRTKKIRAKHIEKKKYTKYQEKETILITRLLCEIKRVLFRWKFVGSKKNKEERERLCCASKSTANEKKIHHRNQRFHRAQITNARESIIQSFVDCSISPMRMVSRVCGRAATERQIFNNTQK